MEKVVQCFPLSPQEFDEFVGRGFGEEGGGLGASEKVGFGHGRVA